VLRRSSHLLVPLSPLRNAELPGTLSFCFARRTSPLSSHWMPSCPPIAVSSLLRSLEEEISRAFTPRRRQDRFSSPDQLEIALLGRVPGRTHDPHSLLPGSPILMLFQIHAIAGPFLVPADSISSLPPSSYSSHIPVFYSRPSRPAFFDRRPFGDHRFVPSLLRLACWPFRSLETRRINVGVVALGPHSVLTRSPGLFLRSRPFPHTLPWPPTRFERSLGRFDSSPSAWSGPSQRFPVRSSPLSLASLRTETLLPLPVLFPSCSPWIFCPTFFLFRPLERGV